MPPFDSRPVRIGETARCSGALLLAFAVSGCSESAPVVEPVPAPQVPLTAPMSKKQSKKVEPAKARPTD